MIIRITRARIRPNAEAQVFAILREVSKGVKQPEGMTALHYMLKKGSDPRHIAMVVRYGARGDIKDKAGVTAIDILRRKKDSALRKLADVLAARA